MPQSRILKVDENGASCLAIHWEPESRLTITHSESDMVTVVDLPYWEMVTVILQWLAKAPPQPRDELLALIEQLKGKDWVL